MIGQEHQVARSQVGANAPRRGGQDQGRHPQLLEHAHRERDGFQVVPFVIVKSALEHDRRHAAERAQQALSLHARRRSCAESGESRRKERPWPSAIRSASSFKPEPRTTASRGAIARRGPEHRGGLFGRCVGQVRRGRWAS